MKNNLKNKFVDFFEDLSTLPKLVMKYGSYILLSSISILNILYVVNNNYTLGMYCTYLLERCWSSLSILIIGSSLIDFLLKRTF